MSHDLKQIFMIPDKVLYTDGRDVTVTESKLQVKNTAYELRGITNFGLFIRRPDRLPAFLLIITGLLMAVCGWLSLISPELIPNLQLGDTSFTANTVALWIGGGILLLGLITLAFTRERYSVRISTAEGEKDAIVSSKKEYISQIVNALNRGINFIHYNATGTRYINTKV
jgi:hypothetical protein